MTDDEWDRVLWTDESKFMLLPDSGRRKIYIKAGEEFKKVLLLKQRSLEEEELWCGVVSAHMVLAILFFWKEILIK